VPSIRAVILSEHSESKDLRFQSSMSSDHADAASKPQILRLRLSR